jgi:alanyl-tRNA synthetase
VFSKKDEGYAYALGSKEIDLRPFVKELNTALHGRGGGKPGFVQGSVLATEAEIRTFLVQKQP